MNITKSESDGYVTVVIEGNVFASELGDLLGQVIPDLDNTKNMLWDLRELNLKGGSDALTDMKHLISESKSDSKLTYSAFVVTSIDMATICTWYIQTTGTTNLEQRVFYYDEMESAIEWLRQASAAAEH